MKTLPLFLFMIISSAILFSCNNNSRLSGHWHLWQINERGIMDYEVYDLLEIDGKSGMINERVATSYPDYVYLSPCRSEMVIRNTDLHEYFFNYDLVMDTLVLKSDDKVKYKGTRCEDECCDKEKDYFQRTGLEIRLPELLDTIHTHALSHRERQTFENIFWGYDQNQQDTFKFWFNPDQLDLQKWIDAVRQRYPQGETNLLIYLDHRINIKRVNELLAALNHLQVNTVKIVGKPVQKKTNEFTLRYIETPTNINAYAYNSLSNWINSKPDNSTIQQLNQ